MSLDKLRFGFLLSVISCLVGACIPFGDPQGPGASGTISLGSGVNTSGLTTLHIFNLVDGGSSTFDPRTLTITQEFSWNQADIDVSAMGFPYEYDVGEPLGTTSTECWRVVAWLSKSSIASTPESGDVYGTVTYKLDDCGSYGDYCQHTPHIDIKLADTVP